MVHPAASARGGHEGARFPDRRLDVFPNSDPPELPTLLIAGGPLFFESGVAGVGGR
jgi:hypothetical protein